MEWYDTKTVCKASRPWNTAYIDYTMTAYVWLASLYYNIILERNKCVEEVSCIICFQLFKKMEAPFFVGKIKVPFFENVMDIHGTGKHRKALYPWNAIHIRYPRNDYVWLAAQYDHITPRQFSNSNRALHLHRPLFLKVWGTTSP